MLKHWFAKKQDSAPPAPTPGSTGPRVRRHSGGWMELHNRLLAEPGLCIIDAGYTSPSNINYFTGLGHSVFLADPVHDAWTENWQSGTDEDGNPVWNVTGFLDQCLNFHGRAFDVVLLWTVLDYLPEPLVAPLVDHLFSAMNPGGQVLAFFHTRMQGDETALCRFHVSAGEEVEMQLTQQFPIQRVFTNRSIQRLFAAWSGFRQFLAKDSVSEVIITR